MIGVPRMKMVLETCETCESWLANTTHKPTETYCETLERNTKSDDHCRSWTICSGGTPIDRCLTYHRTDCGMWCPFAGDEDD